MLMEDSKGQHPMYRTFRNWIGLVVACVFFKSGAEAIAQNDSTATAPGDTTTETTGQKKSLDFRLGPFDLHPRITAGMTYGLWRYARAMKAIHKKYAPPLSKHRTGSKT